MELYRQNMMPDGAITYRIFKTITAFVCALVICLPNFSEAQEEFEDRLFPGTVDDPAEKIKEQRELEKDISYFLEVRKQRRPKKVLIYKEPTENAHPYYRLKPGEIIKLNTTRRDLLTQLRLESKDLGYWRTIQSTALTGDQTGHFFYDWKTFNSLEPYEYPIPLTLNIPPEQTLIPIYKTAEHWGWQDCKNKPEACVAWLDQYAKLFLVDTKILEIHHSNPQKKLIDGSWALFYKVGYVYKTQEGRTQRGVGWIPSYRAIRQIDKIPPMAYQPGRFLASDYYKSDEEIEGEMNRNFLFGSNLHKRIRRNRWSPDPKDNPETARRFQPTLAFDAAAKIDYLTITQNSLTEPVSQYGIRLEGAVSTPLFFDLELFLGLGLTVPIANTSSTLSTAFLYNAEQWLYYTLPIDVFDTPFKIGVGAKYLSMGTGSSNYGFSSLVSFQVGLKVENERFWGYFGVSPVETNFNFKLGNLEILFGGGYVLSKNSYYDGYSIAFDMRRLNFTNAETAVSVNLLQFMLGVKKHF